VTQFCVVDTAVGRSDGTAFMVPSSRGLGHHPLKVATRVRIPLGLPVVFPVKMAYLLWYVAIAIPRSQKNPT